jgi:hypothetical protein
MQDEGMTLETRIAGLFRLTDENWMRHANPWSVRTRYSVLPLLILAFWSRIWLGWWCVLPVVLAFAWMVLNPVFFKKPRTTNTWESKSVLGERVWGNRDRVPVPKHHLLAPKILNGVSSLGMLLSIWGVVALSVWPAVMGVALAYAGKSWYLDRMVWLYEDMKHVPEYADWLY